MRCAVAVLLAHGAVEIDLLLVCLSGSQASLLERSESWILLLDRGHMGRRIRGACN